MTGLSRGLLAGMSALVIGGPACAAGYCSAPSPPGQYSKPDKPRKPTTPFCVNEFAHTHTCSDYVVNSFNAEVDDYNRNLKRYREEIRDYVEALKSYVEKADAYAVCELNTLDD